jgi:hypothetical protein
MKTYDEINRACRLFEKFATGEIDSPMTEAQRGICRMFHAALAWTIEDPAGGDFVELLLADLAGLEAEWAAWNERSADGSAVDAGPWERVLVALD